MDIPRLEKFSWNRNRTQQEKFSGILRSQRFMAWSCVLPAKMVRYTENSPINVIIKNYLTKKFIPEAILVLISTKEELENLKQLQFFAGKEFDNNKTKVYVCRDFTCSLPLETVSDMEKLV